MKDLQQRFKGDLQHKFESYFGRGTVMKGTLKFNGSLRYDGEFEGEIFSEGVLHVGESGVLRADIYTGALLNSGEIDGNVSAGKKISILENGVLDGNITSPILQIDPGAVFNGKCNMPKHLYNKPSFQEDLIEAVPSSFVEQHENQLNIPPSSLPPVTHPVVQKKGSIIVGVIFLFVIGIAYVWLRSGDQFWDVEQSLQDVLDLPVLNLTSKPETVEEQLKNAQALKVDGEVDEAVKILKGIVGLPDVKASARLAVARNFFDLGFEKEAMEEYRNIIALEPDNKTFLKEYIRLLIKNGMTDVAVEHLQKLIRLAPKDIKSHLELAHLFKEKGEEAELLNEYEIIVELYPKNETILLEYGEMLEKRRKFKEAIIVYTKLLDLNESNSNANLRRSRLYFYTGHEGKANKGYEKQELFDPEGIESLNNEGFHQVDLRNTDKAIEIFAKTMEKDKGNLRARFGLIAAFTRKGYITAAIKECEKLLTIEDGFVPAQNRLAWLYGRKGINLDEAIRLSLKTLVSNPLSPDYLDTLSELYFKKGDVTKSVQYIKKALELSPDSQYYKKQLKKFLPD